MVRDEIQNHYVLGFCFDPKMEHVLLIWKNDGPFPNKLNGLGGHIEDNETSKEAMLREIKEETNSDMLIFKVEQISYAKDLENHFDMYVYYLIVDADLGYYYNGYEGNVAWWPIDNILSDNMKQHLAGNGNVIDFIQKALKDNKV